MPNAPAPRPPARDATREGARAPRPRRPDVPAPPRPREAPVPPPTTHAAPPGAPRPPPPKAAPRDDGVRISKLLTERGLASRREADDWIAAGWVKVDGRVAVLGQRVAPTTAIDIDAKARAVQAHSVTIILHKPVGWVSGQAEDGYEPAIALITAANHWAMDTTKTPFHPGHLRHLAPAGRLDIDSTGMLVLTQDGRIAKLLVGENSPVEKEYLVRVAYKGEGQLPGSDLARLRKGLDLDGIRLKPAKVSWANEDQLRFVLREGRKRQIRRMCELVGLQVLGLKRVRIGSVPLGQLPAGQWRYLGEFERF